MPLLHLAPFLLIPPFLSFGDCFVVAPFLLSLEGPTAVLRGPEPRSWEHHASQASLKSSGTEMCGCLGLAGPCTLRIRFLACKHQESRVTTCAVGIRVTCAWCGFSHVSRISVPMHTCTMNKSPRSRAPRIQALRVCTENPRHWCSVQPCTCRLSESLPAHTKNQSPCAFIR